MNSQLKAGAVLNYIIIGLNSLVGLLYTPYMLRMMGQSEYGLYSLVASIISYLTILDLGLGNAIVRYTAKMIAEGRKREQYELFGMFLLFYLVIGVVVLVAGIWIYQHVDLLFNQTMTFYELERARIMMLILVLNLAFTFPMSIFGSIITAYERFVFPKILNITSIVLNTIVMIVLLHMGYKAVALVVVQTVFNFLTLIIQYIYCKYKLNIKILYSKKTRIPFGEICVYSFWIFLEVIMTKVYWSTGQFVLAAISGTIAVAIFAVAIQLQSMYMQFSSAISSVFLPKITQMVTLKDDSKEISDLFIRTGRIQNIIMSIVLLGFIVFGKTFISLWAGDAYAKSYYIALLFFIALYIPLIQNLGITILQARNQMKFRSLLYIIIAVIALALQIVFAKVWGEIGCAIAIAGALFIGQGLIMNLYYYKVQKLDIVSFWKEILKMDFVPIIITTIFIFFFREQKVDTWSTLLFWIVIYGIAYLIVLYFFSINSSEKNLLKSMVNRIKWKD